jgi:crossover junction endodeoxyribonuclease RuvC
MEAMVVGIDPGLGTTGYAVLRVDGGQPIVVDAGVCRSQAGAELAVRLAGIERDIAAVLSEHRPQVVAVEQLYSHYNHPRTAILMGHARGVILLAAGRSDIPVRSYSATRIKRYLTGNGRASKSQVQRAIQITLGLPSIPEPPDVADALAIALCCAGDAGRDAEMRKRRNAVPQKTRGEGKQGSEPRREGSGVGRRNRGIKGPRDQSATQGQGNGGTKGRTAGNWKLEIGNRQLDGAASP